MAIIFGIVSVLIIIDLVLLTIFPKFYSYMGIPIKTVYIPDSGIRTLAGIKAGMILNFKSMKFWNDDSSLWFRTKFNLLTLYSIGFLSITKGIIKKENNQYKCIHVMNLTTCIAVIFLLITPLFISIEGISIVFIILFNLVMIALTLYRNKQFIEMLKFIELK